MEPETTYRRWAEPTLPPEVEAIDAKIAKLQQQIAAARREIGNLESERMRYEV